MKKLFSLFFILALIVIIAVMVVFYSPKIKSYLPENISAPGKTVSGKVLAKRLKGNSLLLTVNTQEGAMLVTFKKKIDEIDLLVAPGDIIEFSYISYRPFLTDPVISRVRKESFTPSGAVPSGKTPPEIEENNKSTEKSLSQEDQPEGSQTPENPVPKQPHEPSPPQAGETL